MREYIDSFHKESKKCAAYQEHNTVCFKGVVNININISSVITQDKQIGGEEDLQANTYNENEVNRSIKENAREKNWKCEQKNWTNREQ